MAANNFLAGKGEKEKKKKNMKKKNPKQKKKRKTLHALIYKMNFPKKKPMKIAAITTRSDGMGLP